MGFALWVLIALGGAEIALRWRHRRVSRSWLDEGLRPETLALDRNGLADRRRIVVFGDSIPYGQGLAAAEAYPALLQNLLQPRHPEAGIAVINAGIPGQTVMQGWARLKRHVFRYHPHLVIVHFGLNDAKLGRSPLDAWREQSFWASLTPWGRLDAAMRWSHLYRAISSQLDRRRFQAMISKTKAEEMLPRVSPAAFRACLRAMARQVHHGMGKGVILCTATPVGEDEQAEWDWERRQRQQTLREEYNALIRSVAGETGAYLLDSQHVFQRHDRQPLLAADGIHLTALGQRLIAESLLDLAETILFGDAIYAR